MQKFYLMLWGQWMLRVVISTLTVALILSLGMTAILYIKEGLPALSSDVKSALKALFFFWFAIFINLSLLLALFRSIKSLFNHPYAGYVLKLKRCAHEREYIEVVGYGDLVKVWRRWFFLLIWIVGSFMVVAFVVTYLFSSYKALFDWFNIYILYMFILIAGYFSFVLLPSRCKRVKVVKW